jgi:hypothetical protein
MGNTVDVNENEYAFSRLEDKLAAVRQLENTVTVIQSEDDQEIPGGGCLPGTSRNWLKGAVNTLQPSSARLAEGKTQ